MALNSNCGEVGGCRRGRRRSAGCAPTWPRTRAKCTVAVPGTIPRFSSGNLHGGSPRCCRSWQALHDYGAELLLSGHDHDYERFAPQTAAGASRAPRGVRQFVVGTGGATLRQFAPQPAANSEARIAGVYGVLSLKLRAGRLRLAVRGAAGQRGERRRHRRLPLDSKRDRRSGRLQHELPPQSAANPPQNLKEIHTCPKQ